MHQLILLTILILFIGVRVGYLTDEYSEKEEMVIFLKLNKGDNRRIIVSGYSTDRAV